MVKKIVWTTTASKQRNRILRFWVKKNKSKEYSLKLLELSNKKAELIAENPQSYRLSDYPDTRVASMGHFSIFYKWDSEAIIITAFWDNRQDHGKLLQQLKKK
jgi:plasmid stabilization system protein ParE